MRRSLWLHAGSTGALLLAAACRDASEPTGPSNTPDPLLRTAAQQPSPDPNALGRSVAGFGGFFLDASGAPTAYLTDPRQRGAAMRALAPWFSSQGLTPDQLRVLRGDFDYAQLQRWFDGGSPEAMAVRGAVFADLDEGSNRLRFGVENSAAMTGIRTALAARGIPGTAVIVEQTEPIRFMTTLRQLVRPVQGGLQINFSQYLCSIGFNASANGVRSFITASHCTNQQGGTEGTTYYQPLSPQFGGTSGVIATEVADPKYSKLLAGCPVGRVCRYSDASRAAYSSNTAYVLGAIEKTTGPNNNSLTINGSFQISGTSNGTQGGTANKVGRTTGWTQGIITNTCVTTNVSGTHITLLCQNFVSAKVGAGDSGSPVFNGSGSGLTNVSLAGVLWGGNQSGTQFVYSQFSRIQQELGTLTVH
jgi:hypothetical protein